MKHWWDHGAEANESAKEESGCSGSLCRAEIRYGLLWIPTWVFAVTDISINTINLGL
jgi:hypothetical protein